MATDVIGGDGCDEKMMKDNVSRVYRSGAVSSPCLLPQTVASH